MIEYLRGELTELTPTLATIDCHGVGYGVNVSLHTYSAIQNKKDVRLWIYEAVREDAYILWGFATKLERELFLHLISVSGIGPGMARMALSAMTPAELCDAISTENVKMLKQIKGIGPKAAQRIVVELRDKVATLGYDAASGSTKSSGPAVNREVHDEAVAALTMLGFSPAPVAKIVTQIMQETPDAPVELVIKMALKAL